MNNKRIDAFISLAKLFRENGYKLYLVGGTVRDYLLNKELSDKCQAEMKLSNNRNFYGYTVVLSCQMSGIGGAVNGFPSY